LLTFKLSVGVKHQSINKSNVLYFRNIHDKNKITSDECDNWIGYTRRYCDATSNTGYSLDFICVCYFQSGMSYDEMFVMVAAIFIFGILFDVNMNHYIFDNSDVFLNILRN